MTNRADLAVQGFDVLSIITALTPRAITCMQTYIETEPFQWVGNSLMVSSECLPAILEALRPWCTVQGRGGSGVQVASTPQLFAAPMVGVVQAAAATGAKKASRAR